MTNVNDYYFLNIPQVYIPNTYGLRNITVTTSSCGGVPLYWDSSTGCVTFTYPIGYLPCCGIMPSISLESPEKPKEEKIPYRRSFKNIKVD